MSSEEVVKFDALTNEVIKIDETHSEHPRNLIPELCKQFYHLGWVTGTGGGMTIKLGNEIYIAPSGKPILTVEYILSKILIGPSCI